MDLPGTFEPGSEHFDPIQTHILNILAPLVPLANLVDAPQAQLCMKHHLKELMNELNRNLSVLQTDPGVDATQATGGAWTEDHMEETLLRVGSVFDDTPGVRHDFASGGYSDLSIYTMLSPQDVH